MIKLINAVIHKYRCIEDDQEFKVESDTTVLVGTNESGKTSVLESLAKSRYFDNDPAFKYDIIKDYPRKLKKKDIDRDKKDPSVVTLRYKIDDETKTKIKDDLGLDISMDEFSMDVHYKGEPEYLEASNIIDLRAFLELQLEKIECGKYIEEFLKVKNMEDFNSLRETIEKENTENKDKLRPFSVYFENSMKLENPLSSYVYSKYIIPATPKFMYYDEYYALPSEVSLTELGSGNSNSNSSCKTARALFELADVDLKNIKSDNYENVKAELEATQADISSILLKYWTSNKNLRINFDIDKKEKDNGNSRRIVDTIFKIRVENLRVGVSLPLENRSKGFNWFFSFLVWFKKIQADKNNTYILLLDEPGLNLHAKAQNDLLTFFEEELSMDYQVIYTTHSPFMIDPSKLYRVRTIVEREDGTHISDTVKEKDPDTIFPLQAALGYDIAQNLFISSNNLVVEGIADLTYLEIMTQILEEKNRMGLSHDITIVPVGGLDKVTTFISLLRGNKLNLVCLLDTPENESTKAKLHDLTIEKIITEKRIVYYNDFTDEPYSDIEDLFDTEDYLVLYNDTFGKNVSVSEINEKEPIVKGLRRMNDNNDFNHYAPAKYLAVNAFTIHLSEATLNRFEKLFKKINKLFEK